MPQLLPPSRFSMSLSFQNVSYAYGDTSVLSALNLEIEQAAITCLLGTSGSGKSTLLHLAAGLKVLQEGKIEIDGELLTSPSVIPPPEQRPIGLMFQENALFPNMTVAGNIAFGLKGQNQQSIKQRVKDLLEMVGLPGHGDRYPHQLSGGQQQRVTLARSLAPQPKVLLMDEPYANIDVTLRRTLREAARSALRQSGTTTVLVTHDPLEALEMGDRIAVLDEGKIVQMDAPQTIYQQPETSLVAKMFGGAQSLCVTTHSNGYQSEYGLILDTHSEIGSPGNDCEIVFRPYGLGIESEPDAELIINDLRFLGDTWIAFLLPAQAPQSLTPLRVQIGLPHTYSVGDRVSLHAKADGFYCFSNTAN